MKTRLGPWEKRPIMVPRVALMFKYILFSVLGFLSALSGIESLNIMTFEGYTTVWSAALVLASAVATVGTAKAEWEDSVEKWSCAIVAGLLLTWVVAAFARGIGDLDLDRITGAFPILICSGVPTIRAWGLFRKAGRP